jgi:8-oxo-dGTP diphosphatase
VLGGNVEEGETPLQCIVREMKEEIDFDLENPSLFKVSDMDDRIEYTFWQRENFNLDNLVLTEGQRLQWFTKKEIAAFTDHELAFGFRAILLDFFDQKPFDTDHAG